MTQFIASYFVELGPWAAYFTLPSPKWRGALYGGNKLFPLADFPFQFRLTEIALRRRDGGTNCRRGRERRGKSVVARFGIHGRTV